MLNDPANIAMPATAVVPSRRQVIAALALGSVALLILGLQPLLLGELAALKRISLQGVGLVAMGEIIALGIGVIMANTLLSPARLSGVTTVGAALLTVLNLLTMRLDGDVEFFVVRASAGLVAGMLVWVTTSIIVRTAAPDRLAAVFLVSQTLTQAATAAFLASVIVPRSGWPGGFAVLAALSAALLLVAPVLRPGVAPLSSAGSGLPPLCAATVVTFGVILAQMGAIGALWAYLDPLGRGVGLTGAQVGALISTVLFMQVIGGSTAAWAARRLGARSVLMMASVLLASFALGLHGQPPAALFCVLCGSFGFVWLFLMPFQVRLALTADPAGRVAVLVPALQLLGVAFGPLLASLLFVTDDDARPVPLVCAGFALAALGLLLVAPTALTRRNPSNTYPEK